MKNRKITLTFLSLNICFFTSLTHLNANELSYGEIGEGADYIDSRDPSLYPTGTSVGVDTDYFRGGDPSSLQVYNTLYNRFSSHPALANSERAMSLAFAFYARNLRQIPRSCGGDLEENNRRGVVAPINGIENQRYIMIVDYTIPHPQDRFFILDVHTGNVRSSPAAHGYGSNSPISACPQDMRINCGSRGIRCRVPVSMSNDNGSGQTSRGFYLTDEGYTSGQSTFNGGSPPPNGYNALQLRGLQGQVNSNALERDVVFHRANYHENLCSNSAGCPAIDPALFEDIKNDLGRALMYIHTVDDQDRTQPEC